MSAAVDASPWWYRNRFGTFGAVYFVGFFFGNLITAILTHAAPLPAYAVWGAALGAHGKHILLIAMVVLVLAAFGVRSWGSSYLRPEVVWNADALGDRLLVDGPFRLVRNPLYFGNMLLAIGVGLSAPPLGFLAIVAGNLWIVLGLMQVETALLRGRYGPAFDTYAAAVPALFPRLTPANVPGTAVATPAFAVGLRSEFMVGAIALSLIVYAVLHW